MDLAKVGIVSLIGVGGTCGGLIAYKYGVFSKTIKIREKLKGFPVTKEDDGIGSARIATLTNANNLHESLSKLKNPNFTKEDIRDGCINNLDSEFKEEDTKFKNIQSYCVYNNQDKLGSAVIKDEESKGTTVKDALKNETKTLSKNMQTIKNKLKAENGETLDNDALKKGCKNIYPEIWLGENDLDFKDAQSYCLEKTTV